MSDYVFGRLLMQSRDPQPAGQDLEQMLQAVDQAADGGLVPIPQRPMTADMMSQLSAFIQARRDEQWRASQRMAEVQWLQPGWITAADYTASRPPVTAWPPASSPADPPPPAPEEPEFLY